MFVLNHKEQNSTKNTQKTSQNLHLQQRFFLLRQKQFLHTGGIPQQYTPGKRKIFLQVRTLRGNACATANVRPSRHSSEKGTPTPGGPSFAVGSQRIKGYYNSNTLQGGGRGGWRKKSGAVCLLLLISVPGCVLVWKGRRVDYSHSLVDAARC